MLPCFDCGNVCKWSHLIYSSEDIKACATQADTLFYRINDAFTRVWAKSSNIPIYINLIFHVFSIIKPFWFIVNEMLKSFKATSFDPSKEEIRLQLSDKSSLAIRRRTTVIKKKKICRVTLTRTSPTHLYKI